MCVRRHFASCCIGRRGEQSVQIADDVLMHPTAGDLRTRASLVASHQLVVVSHLSCLARMLQLPLLLLLGWGRIHV